MKLNQQRKLVYVYGILVVIFAFASSAVAWKYPDSADYTFVGVGILVLLAAVMIFVMKRKET